MGKRIFKWSMYVLFVVYMTIVLELSFWEVAGIGYLACACFGTFCILRHGEGK